MKIALCTELRNVEWFESRLRSLFEGDGQLVIDELWNEKQLSQALRRSRYHAVVIAMTGARGAAGGHLFGKACDGISAAGGSIPAASENNEKKQTT